ncbi:hypothetical protein ALC56_07242 [Trachymyrmex septentrionalis]|uniref:Uncharacterized protein n=1 Tax=Trachymyrmex septentrionalis TaxID=34720 RepID=A0A195FDC4_9HYME|nr:hypothetical protein ALC56_07242 [Trachymyrmex septentrionalis]
MAKSAERLPGTSTRLRTRDDGCCSVNFLKYVLHIYNVVLFVRIIHLFRHPCAKERNILFRTHTHAHTSTHTHLRTHIYAHTSTQERALTHR